MRLDKFRQSDNVEDRRCDMVIKPGKPNYKTYKRLCVDRPRPEQPAQSVDGLLLFSSLLLVAALRLPRAWRAGSPS